MSSASRHQNPLRHEPGAKGRARTGLQAGRPEPPRFLLVTLILLRILLQLGCLNGFGGQGVELAFRECSPSPRKRRNLLPSLGSSAAFPCHERGRRPGGKPGWVVVSGHPVAETWRRSSPRVSQLFPRPCPLLCAETNRPRRTSNGPIRTAWLHTQLSSPS